MGYQFRVTIWSNTTVPRSNAIQRQPFVDHLW